MNGMRNGQAAMMGFALPGPLTPRRPPPWRFVSFGPKLCLQLSSDLASAATPLLSVQAFLPSRPPGDLHPLAKRHAWHTKKTPAGVLRSPAGSYCLGC